MAGAASSYHAFSRLLTPSHAFSRLLAPSLAFFAPSRAFSRLLTPSHRLLGGSCAARRRRSGRSKVRWASHAFSLLLSPSLTFSRLFLPSLTPSHAFGARSAVPPPAPACLSAEASGSISDCTSYVVGVTPESYIVLTPSHAFSRLLTPSHAFSRLRAASAGRDSTTRASRRRTDGQT